MQSLGKDLVNRLDLPEKTYRVEIDVCVDCPAEVRCYYYLDSFHMEDALKDYEIVEKGGEPEEHLFLDAAAVTCGAFLGVVLFVALATILVVPFYLLYLIMV